MRPGKLMSNVDDLLYAPVGDVRTKILKRLVHVFGNNDTRIHALRNDNGAIDLLLEIVDGIDDTWIFELESSLFLNLYWIGSARGTKLFTEYDYP